MKQIGVIGLGVMGLNLVKNFVNNDISVSAFDIDSSKMDELGDSKNVLCCSNVPELIKSLEIPRKIIILVPAGSNVDNLISQLKTYIDFGDIIIDFGNSSHKDTIGRFQDLSQIGINLIGAGISGGELGALKGPSIMCSGDKMAYKAILPYLARIVAKDKDGAPCVGFVGSSGAGHYTKIIHNGIEYAEMQVLAEVYGYLKKGLNLSNNTISEIFNQLNNSNSGSYLIDICQRIVTFKDPLNENEYLIDKIVGVANQKGTGHLASVEALENGIPASSIINAVLARHHSNNKKGSVCREYVTDTYLPSNEFKNSIVIKLENVINYSRMIHYHQGFNLLKNSNKIYNWELDLNTARDIWKEGSILQSKFLYSIDQIDLNSKDLIDEMLEKNMSNFSLPIIKEFMQELISMELYSPCISSNYNYWLACDVGNVPMNLIQAMRDAFGSHTFKRVDRDGTFHEKWLL